MRAFFVITASIVLVAVGTVGFAYSGLLDVAATSTEPGLVRWVLQTTRESSVRRRAEDIAVPDLSGETRVAAGSRAFAEMCAGCHGAPGRDPILGAQDMNPPPPNLSEVADTRTPAELFWVIKHGVRMTGMPAWSPTHSDEQLWELVAFIKRLPVMSLEDYVQLAAHEGESEDGNGHDHGEPVRYEPETLTHGSHAH